MPSPEFTPLHPWFYVALSWLVLVHVMLCLRFYFRRRRRQILETTKAAQQQIDQKTILMTTILAQVHQLRSDAALLYSEKEYLTSEMQNRVTSNLETILALLRVQSANLRDPTVQEIVNNIRHRIQAIALIYRYLNTAASTPETREIRETLKTQEARQPREVNRAVNMQDYIAALLTYLRESLQTDNLAIFVEYCVQPLLLELDQALPVGLIVTEAFTSSVKNRVASHAAKVSVAFGFTAPETVFLIVSGNDICLLNPCNCANSSYVRYDSHLTHFAHRHESSHCFPKEPVPSLGNKLIEILSNQLGGDFSLNDTDGINLSVSFPLIGDQ
jgi:two-component sensor histidine kinase